MPSLDFNILHECHRAELILLKLIFLNTLFEGGVGFFFFF
jgi:hypothetical protein